MPGELISGFVARTLKRYGVEKCRDAWEMLDRGEPMPLIRVTLHLTSNQVTYAADAFKALLDLDVAGVLLQRKGMSRERSINELRPGTYVRTRDMIAQREDTAEDAEPSEGPSDAL